MLMMDDHAYNADNTRAGVGHKGVRLIQLSQALRLVGQETPGTMTLLSDMHGLARGCKLE